MLAVKRFGASLTDFPNLAKYAISLQVRHLNLLPDQYPKAHGDHQRHPAALLTLMSLEQYPVPSQMCCGNLAMCRADL